MYTYMYVYIYMYNITLYRILIRHAFDSFSPRSQAQLKNDSSRAPHHRLYRLYQMQNTVAPAIESSTIQCSS